LGTKQEQQQAVCIKFTARGGQSKDYFIGLAEQLGYEITITEYAPFRVSINAAGDPLNSADWAHAWKVTATAPFIYFRTGVSPVGEHLVDWGSKLFQCAMEQIAPAHTILIFAYNPPE
jgi:uncharacterized protein YmfQ (DUF2313 family)